MLEKKAYSIEAMGSIYYEVNVDQGALNEKWFTERLNCHVTNTSRAMGLNYDEWHVWPGPQHEFGKVEAYLRAELEKEFAEDTWDTKLANKLGLVTLDGDPYHPRYVADVALWELDNKGIEFTIRHLGNKSWTVEIVVGHNITICESAHTKREAIIKASTAAIEYGIFD
jgi:hypothetical protein